MTISRTTPRARRSHAAHAAQAAHVTHVNGISRAEVLDVLDEDTVLVRPGTAPAEAIVRAEIAAIGYVPAVGDRVLVEQGDGAWFVIGALGEARRRSAGHDLPGLVASVGEAGGVELRARAGDLTLSAPGRVVLRADTDVVIEAEVVHTTAAEMVTRAGRLEVHAQRVVEVADDVYRRATGLVQLQAERARTLIEGAYQLVAKRTTVTSEEDTVIDGKRVLLG